MICRQPSRRGGAGLVGFLCCISSGLVSLAIAESAVAVCAVRMQVGAWQVVDPAEQSKSSGAAGWARHAASRSRSNRSQLNPSPSSDALLHRLQRHASRSPRMRGQREEEGRARGKSVTRRPASRTNERKRTQNWLRSSPAPLLFSSAPLGWRDHGTAAATGEMCHQSRLSTGSTAHFSQNLTGSHGRRLTGRAVFRSPADVEGATAVTTAGPTESAQL